MQVIIERKRKNPNVALLIVEGDGGNLIDVKTVLIDEEENITMTLKEVE